MEVFQSREKSPRLDTDFNYGLAEKPCPEGPGLEQKTPSYMDKLLTVVALEDSVGILWTMETSFMVSRMAIEWSRIEGLTLKEWRVSVSPQPPALSRGQVRAQLWRCKQRWPMVKE